MTCNLCRDLQSNMMVDVGEVAHAQVAEEVQRATAASAASRAVAQSGDAAGGGGAPRWRVAHDSEYLEQATGARREGGVARPATRPTGRAGYCAAARVDEGAVRRRTGRRVRDRAVDAVAGRHFDRAALRAKIQRKPSVADPRLARFLLPTPILQGAGAQRGRDSALAARALAGIKKNAAKQGRTIVFIDESGLSERPTRARTWAPRGQTPVLQYHFNWHQLSVIAGITSRRFYFRLFPGAIKSPQIIEFLHALGQQLRRPLLVIWDGLAAHRSALVRQYLEALNGAIQIEQLPAYAPELNPVEYIWGHLKHHELANHCVDNFADLTRRARNRLRSMQQRPTLIRAFWRQTELPL